MRCWPDPSRLWEELTVFRSLNFLNRSFEYPNSKKLRVNVGIIKKIVTFKGRYPKPPTKEVIK